MTTNTSIQEQLLLCLRTLAGTCNYATTQDGVGFNGGDAEFGHAMAGKTTLSPNMQSACLKMLQKYRGQLAKSGVECPAADAIPQTPAETQKPAVATPQASADIKSLPWDDGKIVNTRNGARLLKQFIIPVGDKFWDLWREQKESLKARGVSVSKDQETGDWKACWWLAADSQEKTVQKDEKVEASDYVEPTFEIDEAGLLAYQPQAVKRIVASMKKFSAAIDASDTGTGKTFVACAVARELGLRPIVICPKSVIPSWNKATKYMGIRPMLVINYEMIKRGKTGCGKFVEITLQNGKKRKIFEWTIPTGAMLIFDEAHRAKAETSQNSQMLIAAKRQNIPTLAMSATAATNPTEMKALGYLLGLHNGKDFYQWCFDHGCSQDYGLRFNGGKHHLHAIHREIFPWKGNRIRIQDLGDQFPDTLIMADVYDMAEATGEINAAYEEMQKELMKLASVEAKDRGAMALTLLLRARQKTELLKIPMLHDMINDALEEGSSVAVFLNFNDSLDALKERIGDCGLIRGGQKPDDRQKAIDQFNADEKRVIICNIQAGGVGISLHDLNGNYPRMAIISPTFSAVNLKQALGRVHRAGGKTKSIQKIVFASGTCEEEACVAVQEKIQNMDQLNDGDLATGFNLVNVE